MNSSPSVRIEIRRIDTADWRLLRDVRLLALADAPLSFGSSLSQEIAFEQADWLRLLKRAVWYLAFSEGTPVGMIGGLTDTSGLHLDPHEVHLTSFWVDPSVRQFGIGSSLLNAILRWARSEQFALITLWVSDRSPVAGEFYLRKGFVDTGDRQPLPSNHSVGEQKLSMVLS